MSKEVKNYFEELSSIDVGAKTEKKNGLTYLSWAWAWGELKKRHPTAQYKVYETPDGCIYWSDGKTAWVKTGVIVEGIEHIEYLPIMDFKNKSISLSAITSYEVNKSIQRSLTKAIARHGLALYIYAGEDLPDDAGENSKKKESNGASEFSPQNAGFKSSADGKRFFDECVKNLNAIDTLAKFYEKEAGIKEVVERFAKWDSQIAEDFRFRAETKKKDLGHFVDDEIPNFE